MEAVEIPNLPAFDAHVGLLRFSTAGSVDDGKSTLIGRLLFDSKNLFDDHIKAVKLDDPAEKSPEGFSLALLTDGLREEREQKITIDVAYRYFATPKRRFILADSPGHEQYTRNMATGASTADLTIVLIDARKGVLTQTKRHAFIASLLGVPRLLVAINKMDLVKYSEEIFENIKRDFANFASRLGIKELRFIPVSALNGDNIVGRSENMLWYHGESVLEHLENVYVEGDRNLVDFRFAVQGVIRPDQDFRGLSGQVASGIVHVGDEVTILPSMRKSRIKQIIQHAENFADAQIQSAWAPMSVVLVLEHDLDVSRGDMVVRSLNLPNVSSNFEAMLVWMSDQSMQANRSYIIMHTTRFAKVFVKDIRYRIDVNTLDRLSANPLQLNEVARVTLNSSVPLFLDAYKKNRTTGGFVLIDSETFQTVAAGMIIDRLPSETSHAKNLKSISSNIHHEAGLVSRSAREAKLGVKALTIWCTGLSGCGKSSLAKAIELRLFEKGMQIYHLDGDNLRAGLNQDLGFSQEDRRENIRRVAEVAKLFNLAGISVVCSFISPLVADREMARRIVGAESFVEVYLSTPIEICEKRDPHGLYAKARSGKLENFTGVSAPYEAPEKADLVIDTSDKTLPECEEILYEFIRKRT